MNADLLKKHFGTFLDITLVKNPYIKLVFDNPRQLWFLCQPILECLYGGSAGGGKTTGLLAAALQFVQVKGYSALLLRRSFQDLTQPGSLIPKSHEWLASTDAHWNSTEHTWTFPAGSVIKFGYLDSPNDVYQYHSAEFQFIGFDELTTFREFDYRYMFSRLRKSKEMPACLRMRSASNPGGPGHGWVKQRFLIEGKSQGRLFIPAGLKDNPHLDRIQYEMSLSHLDPISRRQLLLGDWTARGSGTLFRREWFKTVIPQKPTFVRNWVRFWDLAATESEPGSDPDWTAGPLIGIHEGTIYIADVQRFREKPRVIENQIRLTANRDGHSVRIRMEEEKGASGKNLIDHYARHILPGRDFAGVPATGDKFLLAGPLASAAEAGNVVLVQGPWITSFLDEIDGYPEGDHDDQVVACSLGLKECVARTGLFKIWCPEPQRTILPAM